MRANAKNEEGLGRETKDTLNCSTLLTMVEFCSKWVQSVSSFSKLNLKKVFG